MWFVVFLVGAVLGSIYHSLIYCISENEMNFFGVSIGDFSRDKDNAHMTTPLLYRLNRKFKGYTKANDFRFPFVELLTGILFVLVFLKHGNTIKSMQGYILSTLIIFVVVLDTKFYVIPDEISVISLVLGIVFSLILREYSIKSLFLGLLTGPLLIAVLALWGGMGFGDVKIMFGFVFFLGLNRTIMAMLLAFIFGGIIGLVFLIFRFKGSKDIMPFGPFLCIGTLIAFLYYKPIIMLYIEHFIR